MEPSLGLNETLDRVERPCRAGRHGLL